jgi:hypothetical protein
MLTLIAVLLFTRSPYVLGQAVDAASTIELGGLRQARAVITASGSDYLVKVRLLPVQSFDASTNARLNRDKGRELALQALAKHLSGKTSAELIVSGAQVERVGSDGKSYTLELRVPRKEVAVVRESDKAPPAVKQGQERVAFRSELFTRKRDYLSTLEKLAANAVADLQSAAKPEQSEDSFPAAVAEVEQRALKNFDGLAKEIKGDLLLLSVEREELEKALGEQENKVLERSKEALKKPQSKHAKEKSP